MGGDDNILTENVASGSNVSGGNDQNGFRVSGTGNCLEGNHSVRSGLLGYLDLTGRDARTVQNTYVDNTCQEDRLGGSNPEGLCTHEP